MDNCISCWKARCRLYTTIINARITIYVARHGHLWRGLYAFLSKIRFVTDTKKFSLPWSGFPGADHCFSSQFVVLLSSFKQSCERKREISCFSVAGIMDLFGPLNSQIGDCCSIHTYWHCPHIFFSKRGWNRLLHWTVWKLPIC